MFSKVWEVWYYFEKVCLWILFGLSTYLMFTEGLTDRWQMTVLWLLVIFDGTRIRALEKNQESQAS
jgi:hypothetical protein